MAAQQQAAAKRMVSEDELAAALLVENRNRWGETGGRCRRAGGRMRPHPRL